MTKTARVKKIHTAQVRKRVVFAVLKEGKSVTRVSQEFKVARKTVYGWIKRYKDTPSRVKSKAFRSNYPKGKKHPKFYRDTLKDRLLRVVVKSPQASITDISQRLNAGRHAVYNLLSQLELTTYEDRKAFQRLYKAPGRLHLDIKQSIARAAIQEGRSITELAREHNLSRKVIHQWVKRFKKEGKVTERYVFGYTHPRAFSASQEKAILSNVVELPELSIHKLAKSTGISSHGIFNVLKRYGLTYKTQRIAYAQSQRGKVAPEPVPTGILDRAKLVLEQFVPSLAPAPPPQFRRLFKPFFFSSLIIFLLTSSSIYWIRLLSSVPTGQAIGLVFATMALFMGTLFFLYSLKYYLTLALVLSFSQQETEKGKELNGKRKGFINWLLGGSNGDSVSPEAARAKAVGLTPNLEHISLKRKPYVSVHIPFYNEKYVVERAIAASTNFDYSNYEVILCDDSTDETSDIIRSYMKKASGPEGLKARRERGWTLTEAEVRPGVTVKHLHRTSRSGFKGGALRLALRVVDPRTEFISVFDADFVPYPDTLELFLKYFQATAGTLDFRSRIKDQGSNIAAVQGYQWHVLNKSENWITRGVRSEYAGSYVIERSGEEIYGGLKQISGAVYMIRRDALEQVGWETSITEDFQLTLKLYDAGYKVVYTPYIQAPAECVSTLKRLIRQRMRWAEGHSNNIRRMFMRLMLGKWLMVDGKRQFSKSPLTRAEKLEFLYLSPYYLQAFFFLVGTLSWLISETVFRSGLPFWTSLWGWSLVLTNVISLPLMNAVGLFLEESEERDYQGLISFITLSYILVPFQAYSSVKGLIQKEEGPWFRTPKTGHITDVFARGRFYRFISGILPGRKSQSLVAQTKLRLTDNYLALSTANSTFNTFNIRSRKGQRWVGKLFVSVLLVISTTLITFAPYIPVDENVSNSPAGSGILVSPDDKHSGRFQFVREAHAAESENKANSEDSEKSFRVDEQPMLVFHFPQKVIKNKFSWFGVKRIINSLLSFINVSVSASEPEIKTSLFDFDGNEIDVNLDVFQEDSETIKVKIPQFAGLTPGAYTVETELNRDGKTSTQEQDFTWGVLVINTNKSIYTTGDTAFITMGVLDPRGKVVCDAGLTLQIKTPSGAIKILSTADNSIKVNEDCSAKGFTESPDYEATYIVEEDGTYDMTLDAQTDEGDYTVRDKFESREFVDFDVERQAPTRIFPLVEYPVRITVTPSTDFKGRIEETIPTSFTIREITPEFKIENYEEEKQLAWEVDWKKGETYHLTYLFDAPDKSPAFYTLGPIKIVEQTSEKVVFEETRSWQIASDATANMILFWDQASPDAPTGWSCLSCGSGDFYQSFFRGAADYNNTGSGNANHTHTVSTNVDASTDSAGEPRSGSGVADVDHTHTFSETIQNASNLPSYRQLKIIQYDTDGEPANLPQNVIAIFDSDGTMPNGDWTRYSAQDSYYTYGENTVGTTGGSNTHSHDVDGSLAAAGGGNGTTRGGGSQEDIAVDDHTHTFTTTSTADSVNNEPDYIEVVLGQVTNASGTSPPNGMIAMWNKLSGDTYPTGWEDRSASGQPFYQKFIKAASAYNETGGGGATHSHADKNNMASNGPSSTASGRSGTTQADDLHTHTVDVTGFSTDNHLPPYIEVAFAERNLGIDVTGNVYNFGTAAALTECDGGGGGDELSLRSGTTTFTTSCADATGAFTFSGVDIPAAGEGMVIWIDDVAVPGTDGAMAIRYDGTGDSTLNIFYDDAITVTSDDTNPVDIIDMNVYDDGQDADIQYTATDASPDTLSVNSGYELLVKIKSGVAAGSDVFDPNGTVTMEGTDNVHIDDNSDAYLDTDTNSLGGDIVVDTGGSLTIDSDTTVTGGDITITGTLATTSIVDTVTMAGSGTIGGGGTISFPDLTVNAGVTTTIGSNITVNGGAFTTTTTGSIDYSGTPQVKIWDTGNLGGGTGTITIYDLYLGNGLTRTTTLATNNLAIDNSLYLDEDHTFAMGTNSITVGSTSVTDSGDITVQAVGSGTSQSASGTVTVLSSASGTANWEGLGTFDAYNLTIGNGTTTFTVDNETGSDMPLDVDNDFTITANATFQASTTASFTVAGSWANSGTFTANSGTVTFDDTAGGETLSGRLNNSVTSSAFNKVDFNGSGGGWTIQDAMKVSAANAADTLLVTQGTVTLGNGDNDDLEVNGRMTVGSASGTATFQTTNGLTEGSEIIIDINNNASPVSCTNCDIYVGTSTDGDPQGTFTLNENTVLRFNSFGSVQSGLEVLASGKLNITGERPSNGNGTSTGGTSAARICLTGATWSADEHNNKHVRINDTFANTTAAGDIYDILDTTTSDGSCTGSAPSLVLEDNDSADETDTTAGGLFYGKRTITLNTQDLVSANDEHIGRSLHNITDSEYYRIMDSANNGATGDTVTIVDNTPDDISNMGTGDDVDIVDVSSDIISGIDFEVLDYATVTGAAGTACNADNSTVFHGYIYGLDQSETNIQYADICDLGASTSSKEGLSFNSVDASNTNEGVKIDKSRIYDGYYGIYLSSSLNNNTANSVGITNNSIHHHVNNIIFNGSHNNFSSSNIVFGSGNDGFYIETSNNNLISSNISYGARSGSGHGINLFSTASNNILYSNVTYANQHGIRLTSSDANNILFSNQTFSNSSYGIYCSTCTDTKLVNNSSYHHSTTGLDLFESPGTIIVGDDHGVSESNFRDIEVGDTTTATTVRMYGVDLASFNEVTTDGFSGQFIISEDHDPAGQSGLTKVWGEYTVPNDEVETESNDEGLQQFNYANNLWEDSTTPHGYSGTAGAEDSDIDINLTSALSVSEWYRAEVTSGGGTDTPTFTITRSGGTASPATYTLPGTYTESGTGVSFTITDGATDHELGDTYTFVVWPDSNDTNTTKAVTMMQNGDTFTAGTGETVELVGQSGNITAVSANTGNYSFDVTGSTNFNANYYSMEDMDGNGLQIGTGTTVTSVANCAFDNNGTSGGGSDAHITVDASVISSDVIVGGCSFGDTDTFAEYNVTLTGTPGSNYWYFSGATGALAGESNDNDDGDPGMIRWDDSTGASILTGTVYLTDEATPFGSGKTITWALGGTTKTSDDTNGSGVYSIGTFETISSTDILTFYIDDEDGDEGTMVTKTDGTTTSGLDLFEDTVIVRADTATITNANLSTGDDTDDDVHYSVSGSNLTVDSGYELHVWTGDTFDPGDAGVGNITLQGAGGELHLDDSSTFSGSTTEDHVIPGDMTIDTGATLTAPSDPSSGTITIGGSYTNNGTFTAGSGRVTFNATTAGKTLSGRLNNAVTSSAFYQIYFNGSGGGWTVQDAMKVSNTFTVTQGTVTLGNGDNDDLEVNGTMAVGSASGTATFQTMDGLGQGSEIIIDINNNASPVTCSPCRIQVGTNTDANPQGTFTLNENALLRFNSAASVQSGIDVWASGKLNIKGELSYSESTSTAGTSEARVCLTGASWSADDHNNMHVRITDTFTNTTASGDIYDIADTLISDGSCTGSAPSLVLEDNDSADETDTSVGAKSAGKRTITLNSQDLVSADNEHIGRYIHNITDDEFYRIVDSTNVGATGDTIVVVDDTPGDIDNMANGDDVEIVDTSDDVKSGITFEVYDYATVTGAAGTACNADDSSIFHGYITGLSDSETDIQYADICDMGANVSNKYGVYFVGVDTSGSNEGVMIDKTRVQNGYYGIYLGLNSHNNTITNNSTYDNKYGIAPNSNSNTLTNNIAYGNYTTGVSIVGGLNNALSSNITYGNYYSIDLDSSSNNNTLTNNITYGNEVSAGILVQSSSNNILASNTSYSNNYGLDLSSSSNSTLISNKSYSNAEKGLRIGDSTGINVYGDDYGVAGINGADIGVDDSSTASTVYLYGVDMDTPTEVTYDNFSGQFIISEDHDPAGQSGLTKVWEKYVVLDDVAETVSNDEGTQKFNYVDNLWEDSATAHGYSGTVAAEDSDIQITLTSALSVAEWYRAEVTTANGDTPVFTITRSGGAASPSTYTLPGTYTESSTGVQFTITDGATNHELGDTYTFVVWPKSGDTNTQKTITMMATSDTSFTVGNGEEVQLIGQSGSTTDVSTGAGYYSFIIQASGTFNGNYFSMEDMNNSGKGLEFQASAVVTDISNCSFDNNGTSGGANDTHVTVASSIITSDETFSGCSFGDTDTYAEYNVVATGSAGANYWYFSGATGALAGEANDGRNDGGFTNEADPGELRWDDSTGALVLTGTVYLTDESSNIGAGKTITWAKDGITKDSDDTDSNGVYSIGSFSESISSTDILTFYIDNETGDEGTMVTKTDGTTTSGLDLFEDTVIVRADTATITNANLSAGDDTDDDVHYSVSGGNLTVDSGYELHVWNNDTFDPGDAGVGNVTLQGAGGDLHLDSVANFIGSTTEDHVISGDVTIDASATLTAPSTLNDGTITVGGSYTNNGTFTAGSGQVTFNATTTGKTISGRLNNDVTGSAFYRLTFNGSGGGWTIQDAIKVLKANGTDTLEVLQGTVTLGDGDNDDLEVNGRMQVGSSSGTATFETMNGLSQGSEIIIDVNNNASPVSCTNCDIYVGTSTDGDPQGTFTLNENALLRFNSFASVESGLDVLASGKLNITGERPSNGNGTSTAGTSAARICLTGASWSLDEHNGKHVRINDTFANTTAAGDIYDILDTTTSDGSCTGSAPSLVLEDNDSADETDTTAGAISTGKRRITLNTQDLVSANGEHIGRYLHNITDSEYYRIVNSIDNGATGDSVDIVDNTPDDISNMGTGDDVDIVDVSSDVISGIDFEVLDYATVTGAAGTACNADDSAVFHGYIYGQDQSETLIQYADICDLGADGLYIGVIFASVDASNANEGVKINKSRIHDGYYGIFLISSDNNNTINSAGLTDNSVYDNSSNTGTHLNSSDNNTLTSNTNYDNRLHLNNASENNTLTSNIVYGNVVEGIRFTSSHNNILTSNITYGQIYGIFNNGGEDNILINNTVYSNTYGIYYAFGVANTLISNTIYSNSRGLYVADISGMVVVGDDYGVSGNNSTADFDFDDSFSGSTIRMFGVDMASTTEIAADDVSFSGAYLISEDHDPSSQSGLTKIWGEYTVPNDEVETESNDEGLQQFNYTNNLWEDSATPHGYSGTVAAEDSDIDINLTSALSAPEWYRAEVTSGGGTDTPTFTITRSGGSASPSTYTLPGTYTESSTGVQFTIQDQATNHALGDTYTFAVWPDSNDTNTTKALTFMQNGDTFTAGTGETVEYKGQAGNATAVSANTGSYSFSVTGTIDASYYSFAGTDNSGLNIGTGATVNDLDNGTFDDTGGTVAGNSTYITVVSGVLNGGAKSWTGMVFDGGSADSNIKYNVTLSGTPSACANSWTLASSGNIGGTTNGEANDNDQDGSCSGVGYLLWQDAFTSTSGDATAWSWQRKTFKDTGNARYWRAFHDGDEIDIQYSANGTVWTGITSLSQDTNDFSFWHVSGDTYVYICYDTADDIEVMRGTLSATNISWGTAGIALNGTGASDTYDYCNVSRDSSGYLWVVGRHYDGTNYEIEVADTTGADPVTPSFNSSSSLSATSNTDTNTYGVMTPLNSQDMYVTWKRGASIEGCFWDDSDTGGQWENTGGSGGSVCSGGTNVDSIDTGVTGLDDNISTLADVTNYDVHLLYIEDDTTDTVSYNRWDNGSGTNGTWQTEVTLDTSDTDAYVTISYDENTKDLYAVYINTSNSYIHYRQCDVTTDATDCSTGGNWQTEQDWKTTGTNTNITTNYGGQGEIFALWTQGSSSPYTVEWDTIIIPEHLWLFFFPAPFLPLLLKRRKAKSKLMVPK